MEKGWTKKNPENGERLIILSTENNFLLTEFFLLTLRISQIFDYGISKFQRGFGFLATTSAE